jgi:hypothetical protein
MSESGRKVVEGRRTRSVGDRTLRWLRDDSARECCDNAWGGSGGFRSLGRGGGTSALLLGAVLFRHKLRMPRTDITELLLGRVCFDSCSKPCSESAEKRLFCVSTSAFSGTEGGSAVPCNRDGGRLSAECVLSLESLPGRKSSTGRLPKGSGERGMTGDTGFPASVELESEEYDRSLPSSRERARVSSENPTFCCPADARLIVN